MRQSRLRGVFAPLTDPSISAQDAFTNRVNEQAAFWNSISATRDLHWTTNLEAVDDLSMPRHNVLAFYGAGGIGKTALSEELERSVAAWSDSTKEIEVSTLRIDFSEPTSHDLESLILRLRAALGLLKNRWPAFDLVFNLYWARSHPGEPLTTYLDSAGLVKRLARKANLADQMESTLSDLVDGIAGAPFGGLIGVAHKGSAILYESIRQALDKRRVQVDCRFFEPLLDSEPTLEALSYMPSLLAWDLARLQDGRRTLPIVFLDTFEALSEGRTSRDFEAILQRTVFLLPNVLFVITGRNRLDWSECQSGSEFDYVGDLWPNLSVHNATDEPRQHLVGYLSPSDCERYLCSVLTRNGEPAIPPDIRAHIISDSGGLPLYLDLTVSNFLEASRRAESPTKEEFGGPLATVVRRTVRDLDKDERAVLRAASLLPSFDDELLRAASGGISDAWIERLLARPFVEHIPDRIWPYSLHQLLRRAIQETDRAQDDHWSSREWVEASERTLDLLKTRWRRAIDAADRSAAQSSLTCALHLLSQVTSAPPWVLEAGAHAVDWGWWPLLDGDASEIDSEASQALAVRLAFIGTARRHLGTSSDSASLIQRALGGLRTEDERGYFELQLGHDLRMNGEYADAFRVFQGISEGESTSKYRGLYWQADLTYLFGDFPAALNLIESFSSTPELLCDQYRLSGHVYRVNGHLDKAESLYDYALLSAQKADSQADVAKSLTNLAETLCWTRSEEARNSIETAERANAALGSRIELLKLKAAHIVSLEVGVDCSQLFDEGMDLVEQTGYRSGEVFLLVSACGQAVRNGQIRQATQLYERLATLINELAVYAFWLDICSCWLERSPLDVNSEVRWLDGSEQTLARWMQVVHAV